MSPRRPPRKVSPPQHAEVEMSHPTATVIPGNAGGKTWHKNRTAETLRRLLDRERHHASPWLVARYFTWDVGLRSIPPNTPFWICPDIKVDSPDLFGRPVANQENYIHIGL